MHRFGVVDVGTHSTLLLVVEGESGGKDLCVLHEAMRLPRLGEGSGPGRPLRPEAVERTVEAVASLAAEARALDVEALWVVATAAVRDACDDSGLRRRIAAVVGSELQVFAPQREAETSARGALSGLPNISSMTDVAVVDVGGGSTEVARVVQGRLRASFSVPEGTVRLTEWGVRHDPLTGSERLALRRRAREVLAEAPLEGAAVVAVGGTATSLAAMELGLEDYDPVKVHGHVTSRADLEAHFERLASSTVAQRARLPGLHPGRADVVVAGVALLLEAMHRAGADRLVVSDRGVRWGVALSWFQDRS